MLINILLLMVGFVLLMRGADAFVDGASAFARKFNIPEIIIGLTIVAFGTSAPETAVSISSVLQGANGVGVGNILGSNIANILLILGVTAIISQLPVQKNTVRFEIPFVGFISLFLMWLGAKYGVINLYGALALCALFVVFWIYLLIIAKQQSEPLEDVPTMSNLKMFLFIILGIVALIYGSNLTVDSAVNIARALNVSERIIGLTIIAFGTSLPELITCVVAALKKRSDLAIGNIIGSNIFNILFVLGVTGLIQPIVFESSFLIDSAIGILATILLWVATMYNYKLSRGMGVVFLTCYICYIIYLI